MKTHSSLLVLTILLFAAAAHGAKHRFFQRQLSEFRSD